MSIWRYTSVPREDFPFQIPGLVVSRGTSEGRRVVDLWNALACPFCKTDLTVLAEDDRESFAVPVPSNPDIAKDVDWKSSVSVCGSCGWWKGRLIEDWGTPAGYGQVVRQGGASLRELDLADVSMPLAELRDYLLAKYGARFDVHPRVFEEAVAAVFTDMGYEAVVTGYTGDGGIDVILYDASSVIGVQVKRHKSVIKVEQIRSLAGALLLHGMTRGVFVTTSHFQTGVPGTVGRYLCRGYEIDLLDAERFYDALRITRRPTYTSLEDFRQEVDLSELPKVFENLDKF